MNDTAKIQADSPDQVTIIMDGQRIEQFWNESILLSIDNVGAGFSFSTPFFPSLEIYRELFKPFQYKPTQVYIGSELMCDGVAEKITPTLTNESNFVTVQGRSKTGVIVDCTFEKADIKEWKGFTLEKIAGDAVGKFGLSTSFPDGAGAIFEKAGPDSPTTTVFSFLRNLARQRKLLMGQTKDGTLLFSRAKSGGLSAELVEGQQGLIISSADYDGTKRFSVYNAYGQEPGKNDNFAITNDVIPPLRPKSIQGNDTNQGNIKDVADWALSSDVAASIDIPLGYEGWLKPDGGLWSENELISIHAPSLMIYKPFPLLIKSVLFKGSPSAKTTEFALSLPEAYTGQPPGGFPWD